MRTPGPARNGNGRSRPQGPSSRGGSDRRGPGPRDHRPRQGPPRNDRRPANVAQRHSGVEPNATLLFGRNAVLESLKGRRGPARHVWLAEGIQPDERIEEIRRLAGESDIPVEVVPRAMLSDLTTGANHQGVALEPDEYPYLDLSDLIETGETILILDHLQDPQNFGALIRAAEAVQVGGIVIPQDRSVAVTPSVVNASAGAVEHTPVALVANLNRTLERLEEAGYWIAGLAGDEPGAQDLFSVDFPEPMAIVVGSEGKGLAPTIRGRCQLLLRIPMSGQVESLNASTAGAIVLYELFRQRRALT